MKKLIAFVLLSLIFGHVLAQMISNESRVGEHRHYLSLESLGVPKEKGSDEATSNLQRTISSEDDEKLDTNFKNFSACRGPYGKVYRPEDQGFEECMNNDGHFSKPGPFNGKAVGGGYIVK